MEESSLLITQYSTAVLPANLSVEADLAALSAANFLLAAGSVRVILNAVQPFVSTSLQL